MNSSKIRKRFYLLLKFTFFEAQLINYAQHLRGRIYILWYPEIGHNQSLVKFKIVQTLYTPRVKLKFFVYYSGRIFLYAPNKTKSRLGEFTCDYL